MTTVEIHNFYSKGTAQLSVMPHSQHHFQHCTQLSRVPRAQL